MERESHPTDPYANMPPEPPDDFVPDVPRPNGLLTPLSDPAEGDEDAPGGSLNVFAHRETGVLIRILSMDDSYVRYALLDGTGRYSMPRVEYDQNFAKWWRPAKGADLQRALAPDTPVVPPKVLADDWA